MPVFDAKRPRIYTYNVDIRLNEVPTLIRQCEADHTSSVTVYGIIDAKYLPYFRDAGYEHITSWLDVDNPVLEAAEPLHGILSFEKGAIRLMLPKSMQLVRKRL